MEAVLPNPVLNESDPEIAELERMTAEAAANEFSGTESEPSAQEPEPAQPTNEEGKPPKAGDKPDNSDTDPSKETEGERPRGPDGKFLPKEPKPQTTDALEPKPETKFEKAKKDKDRLERNWENFDKEKAQTRAQFEAERAALAQERARIAQEVQSRRSPDGRQQWTAADFQTAAQDFKTQAASLLEENPEEAKRLLKLADQAEGKAREAWQVESQTFQEQERTKFVQQYDQFVSKEFETTPELRDEKHPIHGKLQHLMQTEPMFQITADGFPKMVRVAKLLLAEESVSELTEKNKQLEAEVADLRKRTGIKGSGPTAPSQPKKLEDMSSAEQMAWLEQQTALVDQAA